MKGLKDSYSLHNVAMGLWICSHLLQEQASLTMAEQFTNLRVQPNIIKSSLIDTFVFNEY